MRYYQIRDYSKGDLPVFRDNMMIRADTGRGAIDKYLKMQNLKIRVKASGGNDVHIKVVPFVKENGNWLMDLRKRSTWYQII